MSSFEPVHRRAKALEARLESRIQMFVTYAANVDNDIEGGGKGGGGGGAGAEGGSQEQSLSRDIDMDLNEMSECVNTMRSAATSNNHHEVVKRYHEVHFDYNSEYQHVMSTLRGKRESAALFQGSSRSGAAPDESDSHTEKLLRERSGIANSMKSVDEVIAQAFDAKSSLLGQRSTIGGASTGLASMFKNMPSFSKMVDSISKKKNRENMIIALVLGILLFFTLWWMFLR